MPTIEAVRAAWQSHDGYTEGPRNNETIFGAWEGMNFQPWCASALSYIWVHDCGGDLTRYGMGPKGSAAVAAFHSGFVSRGRYGSVASVGAFAVFGNNAHIGWVDELTPHGFWYWSGNTGQGSYNNGGGVHRGFVSYANPPDGSVGFCYPYYDIQENDLTPDEHTMLTQIHDAVAEMESRLANVVQKEIEALKSEFEQRFPPPVQPQNP